MSHLTSELEKVFKVASQTSCNVLASAMFKELTKEVNPTTNLKIRAIGASSLNQAVKAVATLNGLLSQKGKFASVVPYFSEGKFEDTSKVYSVIELKVLIHELL